MDNTDRGNKPDQADGDPRPAAVMFVTTEHFTLQGARSSTISARTLAVSGMVNSFFMLLESGS